MLSTSDAASNGLGKVPYETTVEMSAKYEVDAENLQSESFARRPGFTRNDQKDMHRMGKDQELMRNFRSLSTLSFTVILQSTWEILLTANTQGLVDGGLAGLFWSYIWTFLGFGLIIASLAEMASMAPTSGGQYHWVSEFAPRRYQKFMSYMTGWMATLSWQAGTASGSFLAGTIIQGLITVNDVNYLPTHWQGTLFVFAMVLIVFVFNIWGARALPMVQNLLLILHVFGFSALIIVLWVLAPRNTAEVVFTQFSNSGGWSSMGLSLMVGQISAIFGLICSDAAAHMSEEVKEAGITVPRAMVGSYALNGLMGLVFLVTYLFCIPSVNDALNDPSGYPFLYVFQQAMPAGGVNALTALVLVLLVAGNISVNASTSRQTFAFARDNGLPFAKWISHVHPKLMIPANSVALSCGITLLLSLINIGSSVAFNAIISLQLVSLMLTYAVSIACVLVRRISHPETLPKARWSLGRFGIPVNVGGLAYSLFTFFWCFWPNTTPVDASTFNWSVVIFVAVGMVSVIMYFVTGRKVYEGPVMLVEREGRVMRMGQVGGSG